MAGSNSPVAENDRAEDDRPELPPGVTEREVEDIEDRARLRTPVIYEIVRREGETEMDRPVISLWWSGVAAGLSISFSLLAQAVLWMHLPATPWRPLVSGFGYSVGFLIVVLARQQLFTENTVTVSASGRGPVFRGAPAAVGADVECRLSRQHGRDLLRRTVLHHHPGCIARAARHNSPHYHGTGLG